MLILTKTKIIKVPPMSTKWHHYNQIVDLFSIHNDDIYNQKFNICQIRDNSFAIDRPNNWNEPYSKKH